MGFIGMVLGRNASEDDREDTKGVLDRMRDNMVENNTFFNNYDHPLEPLFI